jgi:hypothetical protein
VLRAFPEVSIMFNGSLLVRALEHLLRDGIRVLGIDVLPTFPGAFSSDAGVIEPYTPMT